MNDQLSPLYQGILEAVARWLLGIVLTALVTRHIITMDQSTALMGDLLHKLLIASPLLLPLAWGLMRFVQSRAKFLTALMIGKTTEDAVVSHIKSGAPVPTLNTPPATIPGVPTP